MFNGKFPFPPSREAWEISLPRVSHISGISRGSEISRASGNSRTSGISQDMGNSQNSGIPEVRKFPARFPGNGKLPGISHPRLPIEHCCAALCARDSLFAIKQIGSMVKYTSEFRQALVHCQDVADAECLYRYIQDLKEGP